MIGGRSLGSGAAVTRRLVRETIRLLRMVMLSRVGVFLVTASIRQLTRVVIVSRDETDLLGV